MLYETDELRLGPEKGNNEFNFCYFSGPKQSSEPSCYPVFY